VQAGSTTAPHPGSIKRKQATIVNLRRGRKALKFGSKLFKKQEDWKKEKRITRLIVE
jgi:hypothetical protein